MVLLHCDVKTEKLQEKNIKTNISILVRGNVVIDNERESIIEMKIDRDAFDMNITQVGNFVKNKAMNISAEVFEDFLVTQGIRLLMKILCYLEEMNCCWRIPPLMKQYSIISYISI